MRKVWVVGLVVALLMSLVSMPVSAVPVTRKFTVVFKTESLPADAVQKVVKAGGKVVAVSPEVGMIQAEGTAAMMTNLMKLPDVRAVAPSLNWKLPVMKTQAFVESTPGTSLAGPGDLYNAYQWDIKQVTHNGASWRLDGGSHKTVVGIIDTGVNAQHAALAANFMGGRNFVPAGNLGDATETGNPNDYTDRYGHGSHVAGSIAGNGRIYGAGPNLGFRAYRVFGATGGADTSWIASAIVSAVNDGVDVISMSLGGYDVLGKATWTDPTTGTTYNLGDDHADFIAWMRAVNYAVRKGVLVVAAAGNDGIDAGNPQTVISYLNTQYGPIGYHFEGFGREVPGGLPGVIAVSATGPDKSLSSYSNYGLAFVGVSAPGGDFNRYPVGDWYTDMCLSADMNVGDGLSSYVWMAGTSMATPKVSAVAALYIDQYRSTHGGSRPSPFLTAVQVEQHATDLGTPGYDAYFGFGAADAYSTLGGH